MMHLIMILGLSELYLGLVQRDNYMHVIYNVTSDR